MIIAEMRLQKGFSHTKTGQEDRANGYLWETVGISDREYVLQTLEWEQSWSVEGIERMLL